MLDRFQVYVATLDAGPLPASESYAPNEGAAITVEAEYEREGEGVVTNRTYTAREEKSSLHSAP